MNTGLYFFICMTPAALVLAVLVERYVQRKEEGPFWKYFIASGGLSAFVVMLGAGLLWFSVAP